ncbi:MAG: hypothetical protein QOD05_1613 [Microbacteriaceae bacterium]|nr:hypothetical protein [Microbacteriaceae bacterium]
MKTRLVGALRNNGLVFLDQLVSSGTNAVAILTAAAMLGVQELNKYALIQLVATTLIALQRALICEPSLSLNDSDHRADISLRWTASFWLPVGIVGAAAGYALWGTIPGMVTLASIALPGIQDLLRYRAFGLGRVLRTVIADSVWLIAFVSAVLLAHNGSSESLVLAWTHSAGVSTVVLFFRGDRRRLRSHREIFARGKYQLTEWGIAAATSTIPLFVAQAVVAISSVGAFRLAQTLTGPLNTISSFVTVKFLIDAPSFSKMDASESARYVRRANLALTAVAAIYAASLLTAFLFLGRFLGSVAHSGMSYALPITVLSAVVTAPAATYTAYTKAVGMQKSAIAPRVAVLVVNVITTAIGVAMAIAWGVDPLVLPIAATAITLIVAWRITFTRVANRRRGISSPRAVPGYLDDVDTKPSASSLGE